jgi:hypothetical protein
MISEDSSRRLNKKAPDADEPHKGPFRGDKYSIRELDEDFKKR